MKKALSKLTLLISLLLVSCGTPANESIQPSGMPSIDFPTNNLNQKLVVSAPVGWNNVNEDGTFGLMINNNSDQDISFKSDFGAKIFYFHNGDWIETQNKIVYSDEDVIVMPNKENEAQKIGSTFMGVNLEDIPTPTTIRVFVFGTIYTDGGSTSEDVGAYTDLIISP